MNIKQLAAQHGHRQHAPKNEPRPASRSEKPHKQSFLKAFYVRDDVAYIYAPICHKIKTKSAGSSMDVAVVTDSALASNALVAKVPYFFSAGFFSMADISGHTIQQYPVCIIDLLNASDESLARLRDTWVYCSGAKTICIITPGNRREETQANAFFNAKIIPRTASIAILVQHIQKLLAVNLADKVSQSVSERTIGALKKCNGFLESQAQAVHSEAPINVRLMEEAAEELNTTLDAEGLSMWLEAVRAHHSPTYRHSLIVAGVAGTFAQFLNWNDRDCRLITAGGLLHDIGKVKISLSILDKPGRLTDEERELINKHAQFGCDLLKARTEIPAIIKKLVMQHHELLDGTGYPRGLSANQLSVEVRLMTICDIFSALTEQRPYKKAYSGRKAIGILRSMDGKIDKDLLKEFERLISSYEFGELSVNPAQ